MNFSSFTKSFKSHRRRISIEDVEDPRHEEQPILSDHHHRSHKRFSTMPSTSSSSPDDRREVIVKIDAYDPNNKNWKDSPSYEFWRDDDSVDAKRIRNQHGHQASPPSRIIGQRAAGGVETSWDVGYETNELRNHDNFPPPHPHHHKNTNDGDFDRVSSSKELKVSFESPVNYNDNHNNVIDIQSDNQKQKHRYSDTNEIESTDDEDDDDDDNGKAKNHQQEYRRSSNMLERNGNYDQNEGYNGNGDPDAQVLRCTSFQRRTSVLGRLKTKSRLLDPSPEGPLPERKSGLINNGKSGQIKQSGMLGMVSGMLAKPQPPDDEEDDPLFDEDLPEEFRKAKLDAVTLLQWFSLVLIVTSLAVTLAIPEWKNRRLRGLRLWKWEVLILVLICGRLVSGWGIRIAVLLIERNFLLRKRVLYFVYGIRKAVQNCIWLGLVLIAWHYLFDKKVEGNNNFLDSVNRLMLCMLVATLLWLVKTLMVKVLASSFHVSAFFDRIQESLFNQYVIEVLSGPPLIEIKCIQDEEERTMAEIRKLQNAGATLPPDLRPPAFQSSKSGRVMTGIGGLPPRPSRTLSIKVSGPVARTQDDPGITIDHLHRLNPKNISAWNMKRLMNIVRQGVLSTLDEQIMGTADQDDSSTLIRSEFEAKVAARKIFRNVAKPRAKFLYMEDLMRFLREEEALKALSIVEGSSEYEKISKASLKNWVVNAFRERRALALTLNDTKTAVNKLHRIVNVIVGIIILIMCLVILDIATSKFLLFVSSQIVVVAFVFGNTCKTIFEAIIFLFVMHPFDVGDRCEIDAVQMVVEEMNILTTVFLRYDNLKIIYPNSILATKAIHNYYRSPDMGDAVDFVVHIATPSEKISLMNQRIISYVDSKKDHWYSGTMVVLMDLGDFTRLQMSVWLRHRMNYQDIGARYMRRAALIEEMIKIFKELDIEYRLYPLDVNVRGLPPQVNSTRMPPSWTPATDH